MKIWSAYYDHYKFVVISLLPNLVNTVPQFHYFLTLHECIAVFDKFLVSSEFATGGFGQTVLLLATLVIYHCSWLANTDMLPTPLLCQDFLPGDTL